MPSFYKSRHEHFTIFFFFAYNYTDVFLHVASQSTVRPHTGAATPPNESQSPGVGGTELINYPIWQRILRS